MNSLKAQSWYIHRTDLEGFLMKAFLAVGRRHIAFVNTVRIWAIIAEFA